MNAGFSPACCALTALIADKPRNDKDMFKSVAELLEAYPEWKRPDDDKWDEKYWKDLMKTATPKGLKAKLCFNSELLLKLVDAELVKLLSFRNIIKHVLSVVEPKGNKKLILELTACLSGMPATFITGGGMTLATQRVIYLYEREGGVTCTKRRRRPPGDDDSMPMPKRTYYDVSAAALKSLNDGMPMLGCDSFSSLPSLPMNIGRYTNAAAAATAAHTAATLGGLLTAAKLPLLTSTSSTTLPSLPHCPSGDSVVPRYDFPGGSYFLPTDSSGLLDTTSSLLATYNSTVNSGSAVTGAMTGTVKPELKTDLTGEKLKVNFAYSPLVTCPSSSTHTRGGGLMPYSMYTAPFSIFNSTTSSVVPVAGSAASSVEVKKEQRADEAEDDFNPDEDDVFKCSMILAGIGRATNGLY